MESPLVQLPEGYQIQTFLRIASISVAIYEYDPVLSTTLPLCL